MKIDIKREHWRSKLGIFFATSGSAIGLGTLWKLPYLVGQGGGGAFITMFLAFTLVLGAPLFVAELALGKYYQKGVLKAFDSLPSKNGMMALFGTLGMITTFLIAGWYGVVSGWGINYFVMALTDVFQDKTPQDFTNIFTTFRASGSLNILWQAVFVAITCSILARGVKDGIEHFSKIFFSLLFVLVIGLFLFATTLPGFEQALNYILYPDFSKINHETVLSALGLSLFALSLGQGVMVTYGSYLSKDESIIKTAIIVTLSVVAISVLISLMIFPMIFTFGFPPESGEGLLFVTMPYVTEQLPGSMALSALFFLLLIFAALTSYIGQLEVMVAAFIDSYGISRLKASLIAGAGSFLVGLPTALMMSENNPFPTFTQIFHRDFLATNNLIIDWCLLVFSLGVCMAVGFKIKAPEMASVLNLKQDSLIFFMWHNLIRFVVPACLLLVALSRIGLVGA